MRVATSLLHSEAEADSMKWNTRELMTRFVGLGAAAIATRLLASPKGEFLASKLERKVETKQQKLANILRRRAKNSGRHRALRIAGVTVLAIGAALIAGSTKK